MPFRIARSLNQFLVRLAIAISLSTGLVWGRSGLARASDASLDFVGHLISEFQERSLNPLVPAYPQCFCNADRNLYEDRSYKRS